MNLNNIPTCDLVGELCTREGVEKIVQGPDGWDFIEAYDPDNQDEYLYCPGKRSGPCIILRIID